MILIAHKTLKQVQGDRNELKFVIPNFFREYSRDCRLGFHPNSINKQNCKLKIEENKQCHLEQSERSPILPTFHEIFRAKALKMTVMALHSLKTLVLLTTQKPSTSLIETKIVSNASAVFSNGRTHFAYAPLCASQNTLHVIFCVLEGMISSPFFL